MIYMEPPDLSPPKRLQLWIAKLEGSTGLLFWGLGVVLGGLRFESYEQQDSSTSSTTHHGLVPGLCVHGVFGRRQVHPDGPIEVF